MTDAEYDLATGEFDVGLIRAGAAAAARRRELDISQRSLAADGIINAGALIAFEKGRSWPRERTRLKLEEVLRWPPGTIARLRQGGPVPDPAMPVPTPMESPTVTAQPIPVPLASTPPASDEVPLIAQAVLTAVNTLESTIATLPAVGDPEFTPRVTSVLADLRQLEAVAARAARRRGNVLHRLADLQFQGKATALPWHGFVGQCAAQQCNQLAAQRQADTRTGARHHGQTIEELAFHLFLRCSARRVSGAGLEPGAALGTWKETVARLSRDDRRPAR